MSDLRKEGELKWPRDVRAELVNAIGALTTIAALAIAYWLARNNFNVMMFYAYYIIPAGAMLVGALAASGYGVAGWYTGLRMSKRLMWGVFAQLVIAYFIAQYEMFRSFVPADSDLGFWEWFDASTRAFRFSSRYGDEGSGLGVAGYLFRALEIAGFAGGGVLVPLGLSKKPYCEPCRSYKRTSTIVKLAAGQKRPALGKLDASEEQRVLDAAHATVERLFAQAVAGDRAAWNALCRSVDATTSHLTSAIHVEIERCPRCFDGRLLARLLTGQGTQQPVWTFLREQPLTKEQARTLV